MRRVTQMQLALAGVWMVSGCRTATRVTEVPRVDLELSGGNRGYLVGAPPPAPTLKTTRQVIETDVEVPSVYKPTHSGTRMTIEPEAPTSTAAEQGDTSSEQVSRKPVKYDTYVVQRGDSLWSIAAKPEIYGKATAWRRIFDANRALLKSPERVRAGMKLHIPRGADASGPSTTYSNEGVTYKK